MIPVTDPDDERVSDYRTLRGRESRDLLWAEGPTVVRRLLESEVPPRSVLMSASMHERLAPLFAAHDMPLFVADDAVIAAIVGFDLNRGVIAVAARPAARPLHRVIPTAHRLVVLEAVNDAENLGAIARSVRGLGGDGLIIDPTCADPYYRRSVRVSMGEVLHLPIARAPLDEVFTSLREHDVTVWALTPRRDATSIAELVHRGVPERLALVVGAEGPGLSAEVLARHVNVRIPMVADVDSLNVGHAVAAALAVVQSSTP